MLYIVLCILCFACQKNGDDSGPPFETVPKSVPVASSITEASGIACSRISPDHLWVQEDSGHPADLLLVKTDGSFVKKVSVTGATNVDWEDIALSKGPDPALDYIYVADIGDNLKARTDYTIYRFPEPAIAAASTTVADKIRFSYPDGSHDAEAIFVEINSKDIYILTKSDDPAHIYKISYPQNTSAVNQAVKVGALSYGGVTSAALSANGKEIMVKTYLGLNYYSVGSQKPEVALQKAPLSLTYVLEPQGEAVAFGAQNEGFYTLSEKAFSSVVNLYFYKRK